MFDPILRVGLAQIDCRLGEVSDNVQKMVDFTHRAAYQKCHLIVFPEMSDTGYHMPTILQKASTWPDGPVKTLCETARKYEIAIVAGLSERVGNDIYNSVAVIAPSGELLTKYRKIHLISAEPICEHLSLKSGTESTLFQLGGFQIGVMICYDIRFPELARKLTLKGAEVLLVPAAFPLLRIRHWQIINQCRSIENQVYYVGVNRVGEDSGVRFGGCSSLYDPVGTVVCSASETEEVLRIGEISKGNLLTIRDRMKVLQDRKPDLYT